MVSVEYDLKPAFPDPVRFLRHRYPPREADPYACDTQTPRCHLRQDRCTAGRGTPGAALPFRNTVLLDAKAPVLKILP